jgi:hypothetical protein
MGSMRCIRTPVRLVFLIGVLNVLAAAAPAAYAQVEPPAPACDPNVTPALQFAGLPDRIPFGRVEEYGFVRHPESDRRVPEPVVLTVFDEGESIYQDTTRGRGDDLYLLTLYVFGHGVRVNLKFVEVAPDGSSCQRELNKFVRGFRDGKRFEAWVERAGSRRPAHSFPAGAGLSFVFKDRFAPDTPYRVCWRRPNGAGGRCRPHRTGEPRHPDSLFASAPPQPGRWVATWRTGGLIVATWTFTIVR